MSGIPRLSRIAPAVAALLLAGLLQACSSEVTPDPSPPVMGSGTCPTASDFPAARKGPTGLRGPLVPSDKAISVTLCVLPTPMFSDRPNPFYDERGEEPRRLTARADEVVQELNSLQPFDKKSGHGCDLTAFEEALTLVVAYENGRQVTVVLERGCFSASAEGRTRMSPNLEGHVPAVLDKFLARYREQLVATTDPAKVTAPGCAKQETVRQIPLDRIGFTRGADRHPFLPSTLIEATACRYTLTKGTLRLTSQHTQRGDLTALRDTINTNMLDKEGREPCVYETAPTRLDVLRVADATGWSTAFLLPRAPCQELRRGYYPWGNRASVPIEPTLATQLDAWLK